jgi:protein O-GlcNAc transferase
MRLRFRNIFRPKRAANRSAVAQAQAKFEQGLALHQQGQLAQAQEMYRQALELQPEHFDALNMLGVIAAQAGNFGRAVELIDNAIEINPNNEAAYSNRGNALKELKRWDEALKSYEQAIKLNPDYAEAYYNRGVALQELKRWDEALESYDRAITLKPDHAESYNNRGNALQALKRWDEALESYEHAIRIQPDYAEACNNRGNALKELKRWDEALESYDRAIKLKPGYAEAYCHRGNALKELKRWDEVLESYECAIRFNPDFADAYNNRGIALQEFNRWDEALESYNRALELEPDLAAAYNNRGITLKELKRFNEALESYNRAIELEPDQADAHNNRGNVLKDLKRWDEALDSYARAIEIKPDYAQAYNNRGVALQELKRRDEALDSYDRAIKLKPDYEFLYGSWLYAKMEICDWRDVESQIDELIAKIKGGEKITRSFPVLALVDSLALQRKATEIWVRSRVPANHALPSIAKRARHEKIRIGYFSADYHDHATAYLMAGLFERHDRNRFELVAFSFGADQQDGMRKRVTAAFDRFVDVRTQPDKEVALLSRNMEIDIAVDLKGFTQEHRAGIFSYRAAPIQVNYIGYPGTMGAEYIDYIVADNTLIPEESRQYYSEKIAYLPNSYQANDRKRQIADKRVSREESGLPPTGMVFCCFNNNYKIMPGTFDGWMRILEQVEGSVLWLLADNPTAVKNLRREAEARNVSGERLVFAERVPLPEHLARHRAADLFIDTLPYNAHTTASDALWAGLPVLTRIGEAFAGRVAASLLKAVDLPELITTTQEQYEALAVDLAANRKRLEELTEKLGRNRLTKPLFDTSLYTKHLEDAYTQMYERYQADLPPEHIHIPS